MNSTSTEPLGGLGGTDVIIIASVVGAVAGVVGLVILVLLVIQRCYPPDPHIEEQKHMINRFGSAQNSFLSHDYRPQHNNNNLYDNNTSGLEFQERAQLAPTRSRSFQERREVVDPGYYSKSYHDNQIRRSGSLDFGQMRQWDNKFPDSGVPQSREPVRRLPDLQGPEYHVATLPSGSRLQTYHVPRPAIGGRFEPLWQGSLYM